MSILTHSYVDEVTPFMVTSLYNLIGELCFNGTPCLLHLGNEFKFWNDHVVMNTLGLLQRK